MYYTSNPFEVRETCISRKASLFFLTNAMTTTMRNIIAFAIPRSNRIFRFIYSYINYFLYKKIPEHVEIILLFRIFQFCRSTIFNNIF